MCNRRDAFRTDQSDMYNSLLEADLPESMRYDQLKSQNLSLTLAIKDIKAVFPQSSHSRVVLVVSWDEDTRIVPLSPTVDYSKLVTKIESAQVHRAAAIIRTVAHVVTVHRKSP